jgi:hypothetical protein
LDKTNADLTAKVTAGGTELEKTKTALATNQQEKQKALDDLAAKEKSLAQLRTDGARQKSLADTYETMVKSWNEYLSADAARLNPSATRSPKDTGPSNLLKGKVLFDTFLSSAEIKKSFPGLYDRVHMLDQANYSSGRDSVLPALADKIYSISSYATQTERINSLKDEIKKATDASAKEFYQNLLDLITIEKK